MGPLPAELWIALVAHLEHAWVRWALEASVVDQADQAEGE